MIRAITPLILTYNEEANLARTLARLSWAKEIVIVDSRSEDRTATIAKGHPNIRLTERTFDCHSSQWNFGLDQVTTKWALALDADHVLGPGFEEELGSLDLSEAPVAFSASFRYCVAGRPLRGTLYPPHVVLFRPDSCRYIQDGHTQSLQVSGGVGKLRSCILHDDRKPLSQWLVSQDRYAKLEVVKLLSSRTADLPLSDRIRKTMVLSPPAALLYALFVSGVALDGWHGWYYAFQRMTAEAILSMRLLEKRIAAVTRQD